MKYIYYAYIYFFLPSLFGSKILVSQNNQIDSLRSEIATLKEDSSKAKRLNYYGREFFDRGDYITAMEFTKNALKISLQKNYKYGQAMAYNNLALILFYRGEVPEALKYNYSCLKLWQELKNKKGIANSYNNIGNIFDELKNYPEALKNHLLSLSLKKEIGDKVGIADSYNNLGLLNESLQNEKEALKYYRLSFDIDKELNDELGMSISYVNIGYIYEKRKDYREALVNYLAGYNLSKKIKDNEHLANSSIFIGGAYLKLNDLSSARQFLDRALTASLKIKSYADIRDSYFNRYLLEVAEKNKHAAFENYKQYIIYRDSISNEENTKKTVQTQMQYEFDKKEAALKADQDKKDLLAAEEKNRQEIVIYSISTGLFLVILLAFAISRSLYQNRIKNRIIMQQKELVEKQKHLIEEKQKEVLDSIYYARRIQRSLLTSEKYIAKQLARY